MKNNDDLLSVQQNIYTLVDKDGYLVREDVVTGERQRYPYGSAGAEVDPIFSGLSANFATSGQLAQLSGIVGEVNTILEDL